MNDPNQLAQLGAAGLLILLVMREMFSYLKSRKAAPGTEAPPWADLLVSRVREIYVSHDKLELVLGRLADNAEKQTAIMAQLSRALGE